MEDGEQTHPHVHFNDNPHVLLATTLAALVFAGSAYLWRSNKLLPRHLLQLRGEGGDAVLDCKSSITAFSPGENHGPSHISGRAASESQVASSSRSTDGNTKEQKSARPKDRRRRGKDPTKEILKSEKKLKTLLRSRPEGSEGDCSLSAPFRGHRSEGSQSSRDPSVSAPSRSASTAASSSYRPYSSNSDFLEGSSGTTSFKDVHDVEPAESSSTPTLSPLPTSGPGRGTSPLDSPASFTARSNEASLDSREPDTPLQEHDLACSIASLSALSTTSHYSFASTSTSASSDSVKTPSTPLSLSLPENIPAIPTATRSLQPLPTCLSHHNVPATPISSPRATKPPDSWDWDGSPQAFGSDPAFCKAPRFRSKSRGSGSSISSEASFPSEFPAMPTFSCNHINIPAPVTHPPMSPDPNLSPDIDTRSSSSQSSTPCNLGHPSEPSVSREAAPTAPPALAMQTQIASLRGALEAARLREEKMKSEAERYAKELEVVRWESMSWRHRELELKTQVQYLLQQLQAYTALFATMPMQQSLHPHFQPAASGVNAAATLVNSPSFAQSGNLPLPNSPPAPVGLQSPGRMLSPNHGMTSPTNGLSPMPGSLPHSPFIGYPSYAHPSPSHPQSPHPPNPFSLLFPYPGSNGRSTPNPGSSTGSLSPDLSCLSSPKSSLLDRGRRRTRTKPQGGIGMNKWQENGDEWVVKNEDHESSEEEYEINELLADAILKRPASLGIKRSRKDKRQDSGSSEQHSPTELTFPSIADTTLMKEKQRQIQQQQQTESTSGGFSKPTSPLRKELASAAERSQRFDEDSGDRTLRICEILSSMTMSRQRTPDPSGTGAVVFHGESDREVLTS
ncbi:hypothetical protein BDN72DRAFT_900233 [Pluteus cervinus]|uniref:Uncharacterized protein n=1 Tax=Pluteus cervinus TaxID=181527 RepID=A0ACD3AJR0_9AGAR|nr:hypothetical protein BDN72DRAFT_900233 [Pluteus cervinus]